MTATLLISLIYVGAATRDGLHVLAAMIAFISISLVSASVFGSRAAHRQHLLHE